MFASTIVAYPRMAYPCSPNAFGIGDTVESVEWNRA